jgi:hypothetical protein
MISDNPELAKLWNEAVQTALEPKFQGGSAKENLRQFSEDIETIAKKIGVNGFQS